METELCMSYSIYILGTHNGTELPSVKSRDLKYGHLTMKKTVEILALICKCHLTGL